MIYWVNVDDFVIFRGFGLIFILIIYIHSHFGFTKKISSQEYLY